MTTNNALQVTDEDQAAAGLLGIESDRAIQQMQAAYVIAKKFPRNVDKAIEDIEKACARKELALVSLYDYGRGGSDIRGESIRLAEVVSQCWGNFSAGTIELSRKTGESQILTEAIDYEKNIREFKIFTVKHVREYNDKDGKLCARMLLSNRDIYEEIANQASRRRRACIIASIPRYIWDMAKAKCEETILASLGKKGKTRTSRMLEEFAELKITPEMIEKRMNKKVADLTDKDFVQLTAIFQSIKDGFVGVEVHFDVPSTSAATDTRAADAKARLAAAKVVAPVKPKPVAADSFEKFSEGGASLFSKPVRTREEIGNEIYDFIDAGKLTTEELGNLALDQFKKGLLELSAPEMERILDLIRKGAQ